MFCQPRRYPPPPAGVDIDYFYDSAIRADLMTEVLLGWQEQGELDRVTADGAGADYYVIHPVLKHLALLSLEAGDAD